jgi:hypothetical protein
VVGTDRFQSPNVTSRHQPSRRLHQLLAETLATQLGIDVSRHHDSRVHSNRGRRKSAQPRHIHSRSQRQMTNRLFIGKGDHSATAPMPRHSLSPLRLDLAPIHMIGGRGQIDETGLPKGAPRAGSRQQR